MTDPKTVSAFDSFKAARAARMAMASSMAAKPNYMNGNADHIHMAELQKQEDEAFRSLGEAIEGVPEISEPMPESVEVETEGQ